ncbi:PLASMODESMATA CALLOSE-BINDING PROTEIN 2-like [Cicer arietinum]|uniref:PLASMODESMATA CALLOSE-BINDING PROTEIN 3-like n=1 Tax=Cicer arietinum TaxID=3827 RepID=A0A1S2YLF2_CICAR|nr:PLASMODESMATA CALLOSE-BINDING PROTEIN 3-like [Cicer arietinum]
MIFVNVIIVGAIQTWCVAKKDVDEQSLLNALNYACRAGANCKPIQPKGECYYPNTIQSHASYAFDSYYHINNQAYDSCDFGGTGLLIKTDPSYRGCRYPSTV